MSISKRSQEQKGKNTVKTEIKQTLFRGFYKTNIFKVWSRDRNQKKLLIKTTFCHKLYPAQQHLVTSTIWTKKAVQFWRRTRNTDLKANNEEGEGELSPLAGFLPGVIKQRLRYQSTCWLEDEDWMPVAYSRIRLARLVIHFIYKSLYVLGLLQGSHKSWRLEQTWNSNKKHVRLACLSIAPVMLLQT